MKKCKQGHYYCYKDSKCKPIPNGYRRGVGGYLRREREDEQEDSTKNGNGKSNGSSNGNGNGGNGSGNGNGSSGGNGGGNGSGGIGENVEIKNSDGETTAIVVDIIGPAHMKPMVNNSGVWNGTDITEKKLFPQGFLDKHKDLDPKNIRDFNKLKQLLRQDTKKGLAMMPDMPDISERTMTKDEKEKKEDIVKGMKKDKNGFKKRYGKDAKSVMYATATKLAMEEKDKDHEPEMIRSQLKTAKRASKKIKKHTLKKDNFKAWVQSKITKASDYLDTAADYLDSKDDVKEGKDPKLSKIVKQLRKSVKSHSKQADYIEKINEKNCGCGQTPCKTYGKDVKEAKNIDDKLKKTAKELDAAVKMHTKQAKRLRSMADVKEESNPRIPRKKGQPANSKKHSDLYTDENPKGTIHGLGFKDVATAKASVSKIRSSSRSHAHKIQAAVAMEQRAREMGKTSEAAVYRKYINSMKKKTKD